MSFEIHYFLFSLSAKIFYEAITYADIVCFLNAKTFI